MECFHRQSDGVGETDESPQTRLGKYTPGNFTDLLHRATLPPVVTITVEHYPCDVLLYLQTYNDQGENDI